MGEALPKNANSTSSTTTTPTFDQTGQDLISALSGNYYSGFNDSTSGQYLNSIVSGSSTNPYLEGQMQKIRQQSAYSLPQELASARSSARNRPDTYGDQLMANTVADNLNARDLQIAELLTNQYNTDQSNKMAAANNLLNAQTTTATNLLSLLRGESSGGTNASKSSLPQLWELFG